MIHPSDRWRFIEAIGDRGYFEDDVVQHSLTDHRAFRRSFSEKLCGDPVAIAEVKEQTRLAAASHAPALPRIYMCEEVKGRFTVISELIEGTPLEEEINRQKYVRPLDWANFAMQLLDELQELRHAQVRFHKLSHEHIVVLDSGDIKIAQRWPVGSVLPATLDSSATLQRMYVQTRCGVFVSNAPADEAGEIEALKQILIRMAAGASKFSFEQLRDEVRKAPHLHPSPLANVDYSISQILMGMHPRPDGTGEFTNLSGVHSAVRALYQGESHRHVLGAEAHGATPGGDMHDAHSPGGGSSHPGGVYRDAVTGAPKDPVSGMYRDAVTGAPVHRDPSSSHARHDPISTSGMRDPASRGGARDPATGGGAGGGSAIYRDPATGPHPGTARPAGAPSSPAVPVRRDPKSGSGGFQAVPIRTTSEDENPYSASAVPDALTPVSVPAAVPVQVVVRERRGNIITWVAIIVVIAAIGAGIYFALPLLQGSGNNHRPVAAITPLSQTTIKMSDRITIDASGTKDEDGDILTYYWRMLEPAGGRVIFTDKGSNQGGEKVSHATRSPAITAQFITTGEFVFELRVNDGALFSEPVTIKVRVDPPSR